MPRPRSPPPQVESARMNQFVGVDRVPAAPPMLSPHLGRLIPQWGQGSTPSQRHTRVGHSASGSVSEVGCMLVSGGGRGPLRIVAGNGPVTMVLARKGFSPWRTTRPWRDFSRIFRIVATNSTGSLSLRVSGSPDSGDGVHGEGAR